MGVAGYPTMTAYFRFYYRYSLFKLLVLVDDSVSGR